MREVHTKVINEYYAIGTQTNDFQKRLYKEYIIRL